MRHLDMGPIVPVTELEPGDFVVTGKGLWSRVTSVVPLRSVSVWLDAPEIDRYLKVMTEDHHGPTCRDDCYIQTAVERLS